MESHAKPRNEPFFRRQQSGGRNKMTGPRRQRGMYVKARLPFPSTIARADFGKKGMGKSNQDGALAIILPA